MDSFSSHTLFDLDHYTSKCKGNIPTSYSSFCKLFHSMGKLRLPLPSPSLETMPSIPPADLADMTFDVPSLEAMGYSDPKTAPFKGGESEALRRLEEKVVSHPAWVSTFEKPNTSPNSLAPSTTVLSPYLKFGCLSATTFYHALDAAVAGRTHTQPPVSLHGQLLWREFFYLSSVSTPHFDRMEGNPRCRQIPWARDPDKIAAWKEARTGYPYIDAIMTQLRHEGWIHHLVRHSVACFLTRGDLWQHWEEGVRVFDLLLLDDDWALNTANWQWLSCSNFFYQYFRVYSPVAFGKKTDKEGDYIRKWIPVLANYPAKYIYEPWKAPLAVQRQSGCVVGEHYPARIVDHEVVSKENMQKMKLAYGGSQSSDEVVGDDGEASQQPERARKS